MSARPKIEVEFVHNGDRLLHMLRKQHPDYHPIMAIAKIAHAAECPQFDGMEPDLELALKAHTTVLRYVEPELKSIEISTHNPRGRTIEVSLFDDSQPSKQLTDELSKAEQVGKVIDVEFMDREPANESETV